MSDIQYWRTKIAGFLHDPPDKALSIPGHEERRRELFKLATGEDPGDKWRHSNPQSDLEKATHKAFVGDINSSAADRLSVDATKHQVPWTDCIHHPLSGEGHCPQSLCGAPAPELGAPLEKLKELCSTKGELSDAEAWKRRYLLLWRQWRAELIADNPHWQHLVASTRCPDGSIWWHMEAAAAVAGALEQPAHFIFTISPCQEFISEARRTSDLWMGSYILSYLCWKAMAPLVDKLGPDSILYPTLYEQPLTDWLYLKEKIGWTNEPSRLDIPTFPNRFLALIPSAQAESIGEKVEQAASQAWSDIALAVKCSLLEWTKYKWGAFSTWEDQIAQTFQFNWIALPWPEKPEQELPKKGEPNSEKKSVQIQWAEKAWIQYKKFAYGSQTIADKDMQPADSDFASAFVSFIDDEFFKKQVQIGTCYSRLLKLAEQAMGSMKQTRLIMPAYERGELCTLCGHRSALSPGTNRKDAVEFWTQLSNNLISKGRHREIKTEGKERLCAVCATKRFAQDQYFAPKEGWGPVQVESMQQNFPSTSTIAAADYIANIVEKVAHAPSLLKVVEDLVKTLEAIELPQTHQDSSLTYHNKRLASFQEDKQVLDNLLKYDGDIYYDDFFTKQRLVSDYGEKHKVVNKATPEKLNNCVKALRKLKKELKREIPNPPPLSPYYAVLCLDGDCMGKWLQGENAPKIGSIVAHQMMQDIEFRDQWKDLLGKKRFVSPSFHKSISGALCDYALKVVPHIVEELYPGKLIYAGGDDVLALVPLSHALQLAEDLRCAFRGEGRWDVGENRWVKDLSCTTGYMRWENGSSLCMMGPTASASVGIAITHQMDPLAEAIQRAHELCDKAKNEYDRDALAINVVKRSGAPLLTGGKFIHKGSSLATTMNTVVELLRGIPEWGTLSTGMPSRIFEEIALFEKLPLDDAKFAWLDIMKRSFQPTGDKEQKKERRKRFVVFCENDLWGLTKRWSLPENTNINPYRELAQWLLVARFIASPGGAE